MFKIRWFLCVGLVILLARCGSSGESPAPEVSLPNIVLIFTDDQGYGDLGSYGHPTLRTPHLDRLALEGQRWTNFYMAASVCTPSRAGLLTGRLPVRSGMASDGKLVIFEDSLGGLPAAEMTLAEGLRGQGYATACIGKWHLGHLPEFMPLEQGFDYFYGVPYHNTADRVVDPALGRSVFYGEPKVEWWNLPLMRGTEVIERPADQRLLTKRYTAESIQFIQHNRERPFFLFLSHTMPHAPLFRSEEFVGVSERGRYGDVIEELDWSVGEIIRTLREEGLDTNTLVIFTSDNGPALGIRDIGGSAGLLRNGKLSSYEGGFRVPAIFWWPGRIQPQVVMEMGSALDLLPTLFELAGAPVPADRVIDGMDLRPVLMGTGPGPRNHLIYYDGERVFSVRKGPYKAHFRTREAYGGPETEHDPPVLYHLGRDPAEQFDIAEQHPEIIEEIRALFEAHLQTIEPVENQLEKR